MNENNRQTNRQKTKVAQEFLKRQEIDEFKKWEKKNITILLI